MIVTREWIHAHKTVRGGWTKRQFAALGVTWPLKHGWLEMVVGLQISDEQVRAFEHAAERTEQLNLFKETTT